MEIYNVDNTTDLSEFNLNSFFQTQNWLNLFSLHGYINCSGIFEFEDWVKVYLPLNCIKKLWFLKWAVNTNLWGYWWFIFNKEINIEKKEIYIIQILKYLKNKYSYINIVPYPLDNMDYKFINNEWFVKQKSFTHILKLLDDINILIKTKYKKTYRYEFKKSIKEWVIVEEWNWNDYYNLYLENLKKWWKYDNLWKTFFKDLNKLNNVKFIFAYYNKKIISAAIFFFYWNEIFYWASYTNDMNKNLFWIKQVIYYIHKKYWWKYTIFNCWSSEWLPGVQKFKESFWAEKKEYFYYEYKSKIVNFLFFIKKLLWKK